MDRVLYPRSVAVIGASANPAKTGHVILRNIIDAGYKGDIYPINPKGGEILGLKVYRSVLEVPGEIDLAVVVVPARVVPSVMEEIGRKGIPGAVIISGGFGEAGEEGARLEEEVGRIARQYNVRVIGPNCQGVNNTNIGLCASWPLIKENGPMTIVSQSGTVGAAFEGWAAEEGYGISFFVGLGNRLDVDETDLLSFFVREEKTKVVAMYIEGVKRGPEFRRVLEENGGRKPIVILKSGRSPSGARAVQSHTRSLAGRDEVFTGLFRQYGVVRAETVEELYDFSKALAFVRPPSGPRVMIVSSSGGSAIISVDMVEGLGMELAQLPEWAKEELRARIPPYCIVSNPLDLTGDADAERYDRVLDVLKDVEGIDTIVTIFGDPIPGAAEVLEKYMDSGKTVIAVYIGGGEVQAEEVRKMGKRGIPVFPTPERAIKALKVVMDRASWLKRRYG